MFEDLNSLSLLLSPQGEQSVVLKDMTSQLSHICTEMYVCFEILNEIYLYALNI